MAFDCSDFENRLRKNYRHLSKWAKRHGITCFRIYDNDMPNYPLAIDQYENNLYVVEYKRNHNLSADLHADWLQSCLITCESILQIRQENIFVRRREPQKGNSQYTKLDEQKAERIVQENDLFFRVNMSDYLDTGLFLDHRITRKMVQDEAAGKRILNLFAYTGSFTVYAAAGKAAQTVTVDLSNTYLQWAKDNLKLNRLDGQQHYFEQADVLQWLNNIETGYFDMAVLDPPAFSNSKRMKGILDIGRDHPTLINQTLQCLKKGGVLYFSTNLRRFKLKNEHISAQSIQDITHLTIPPDFRNKQIHCCFRITR